MAIYMGQNQPQGIICIEDFRFERCNLFTFAVMAFGLVTEREWERTRVKCRLARDDSRPRGSCKKGRIVVGRKRISCRAKSSIGIERCFGVFTNIALAVADADFRRSERVCARVQSSHVYKHSQKYRAHCTTHTHTHTIQHSRQSEHSHISPTHIQKISINGCPSAG